MITLIYFISLIFCFMAVVRFDSIDHFIWFVASIVLFALAFCGEAGYIDLVVNLS